MAYKSTRRQWVKLWVNEWLDGTTRFELTAQQRLLWIDLLALAGRSRFPGFIYAGDGQGSEKIGYPIAYLAGVLQMDEQSLNNALILLQDHKHITIQEPSPERFIIGIANWEKYQSEYLRQKAYRKVTTKNTNTLPVEGEGEVDVEGEVDSKSIVRKQAPDAPSFESFIGVYPRAEKKLDARKAWEKIPSGEHEAVLLGLANWIGCDQWQDKQFIPLPATFLRAKQWNDTPVKFGGRRVTANQQHQEALQRETHAGLGPQVVRPSPNLLQEVNAIAAKKKL